MCSSDLEYDQAAQLLTVPVPNTMFNTRFGVLYLYARGTYYLATGRPSAALGNFQACADLTATWGFDQPSVAPWRIGAAHAHRQLGAPARARALAEEQLARRRDVEHRIRGMALRVLAEPGSLRDRVPLLTDAVAELEAGGDRLELARALACLGWAHRAQGRPERAAAVLGQARETALACHAHPLVQRLEAALARLADGGAPGRPARSDVAALSDAELRVALLAAEGRPNREIADRLSITASTVEQHLTRIFRKLDVRRRWDLPEKLSRVSQS